MSEKSTHEPSGDDGEAKASPPGDGDNDRGEEVLDEIEELDDDDLVIDEDREGDAGSPPPPPALAAPKASLKIAVDFPIELPTVLDQFIEDQKAGDYGQRADRLAAECEETDDKRRAGALSYEIGELAERRLDDEARAVKSFGKALQADPSLRANLWAIRRVFYRRKLWPNLVKLIGAEVRFASDEIERADLMVEKGHVLEDQIGDVAEAQKSYEQALAFQADCVPALLGLERLALSRNDEDALRDTWRKLADSAKDPRRKLDYLLDLARLESETDGGIDRARDVITEALSLEIDRERVARHRVQLAELARDTEALIDALESRIANLMSKLGPVATAAADGEVPADSTEAAENLRLQVVALRRRQARTARPTDAERAWGYLQEALALSPREPLLLADLADLAEELGKFDELADLVAGWESQEADPARALSLSLRRADALFRAGQSEQAQNLLSSLAASAPGYLPILSLRERDALARGDSAILAEVLGDAADAARLGTAFGPGTEAAADLRSAAASYTAAGDLFSFAVGDDEQARSRYGQALEVAPGYGPALDALVSLHESAGRLDEAASLLELHTETASDEELAFLLERLAQLYRELGQPDDELSALNRLVALDGDDADRLWRCEHVLFELDRPRERALVLERLAELVPDPDCKAGALIAAGRLHADRLDEPARAAELFREALELSPGDRYARDSVLELLRRSGKWKELVAERRAEAEHLPDGPLLARALREAAHVLLVRLGDAKAAVTVYRDLLDRVPQDRDALRGLGRALLAAGDTDAALGVYEREVETHESSAARAIALLRLGDALDRAGKPEDAGYAFRRAAEEDGANPTGAVALAEIARRSGDHIALIEALELLSRSVSSDPLRADMLEEIGWMWAVVGGDPDAAAEAFDRAASADGTRAGVRLGSALAEAKRGEPIAVGDALAELGSKVRGEYAAASLLVRSALTAEVQGDHSVARARVGRALLRAPEDPGTVVVAAELLGLSAEEEPSEEQIQQLAELYSVRSALAEEQSAQDDWELDRAEILERGGQLAEALAAIRPVLERRPHDIRALQLLRRVSRRGGDRRTLADASVCLSKLVRDKDATLALLREAGMIYDSELASTEPAIFVFRKILETDPGAEEFVRLKAIYEEHNDRRGIYELLSDRIKFLDHQQHDPREKAPLLHQRARLRAEIKDAHGASRDLEAVLQIDGGNIAAMFEHAGVLAGLGEAQRAANLYREYLDIEHDPSRRSQAEFALASLLSDSLGDIDGAIELLEGVVRHSPQDARTREQLTELVIKAGQFERAIRQLRELEPLRETAAERAALEKRIARIARDELHDVTRARGALERARQLDPLDMSAVRSLTELYADDAKGKRVVLGQAAADVRAALNDDPKNAELYARLATIAGWVGDRDSRHFALSALATIGTLDADQKRLLAETRTQVATAEIQSGQEIDAGDWRTRLAHPHSGGFASELWRTLADAVAKVRGEEPSQLGFGRGDRVKAKDVAKGYPAVGVVMAAYGASGCDIWVSDQKTGMARALCGSKPTLLLGADVAAGENPSARFALARAIASLRDGTGGLEETDVDELGVLFAAAAEVAGVSPMPQTLAGVAKSRKSEVDDRVKHLHKNMGRKEKKNLALVSSRFSELTDVAAWRRATLESAARAGLLACGDLDVAIRGSDKSSESALALAAWAVGDDHIALRKQLGLA